MPEDNEQIETEPDETTILADSKARIAATVTLPEKPPMDRLTVPVRRALLGLDSATNLVDGDPRAFLQAQLVIAGLYDAIKRVLADQERLTLPEIRGVILIAAQAITAIIATALEKDKTLRVRLEPSGGKRQAPRISNRA